MKTPSKQESEGNSCCYTDVAESTEIDEAQRKISDQRHQ